MHEILAKQFFFPSILKMFRTLLYSVPNTAAIEYNFFEALEYLFGTRFLGSTI